MKRAMPMAAWAITLALISPLAYIFGGLAVSSKMRSHWSGDTLISQQIAAFLVKPAPAGVRRGVMFGVSGGYCVFAGPTNASEYGAQVLPVAAISQGFEKFYPFIDQVIAMKPDFILIQATALVHAGTTPPLYEIARRHLRGLLLASRLSGPEAKADGFAFAGAEHNACKQYLGPPEKWRDEYGESLKWISQDLDYGIQERLLAALSALLDSGIPIFIFDVPRNEFSDEFERIVHRKVDSLLAKLGEPGRRRLTIMRDYERLPIELFYDPLHVGPEGATWFRRRLLDDVTASLVSRKASQ
jgi:hypothetical protein